MKLKKINIQQKIVIFGLCVVLFISIIFLIKKDFYSSKGFSELQQGGMNIMAYVEGLPNKIIPKKDSEYAVDKIECNNNSQGYWNYKSWELNLKNINQTNTKCKIYFVKQYKELILNGTDPIITDNLIPITIDNDGTVKKADREKSWYSYENKVWANAIILEDEIKTYNNGEVIPESNIESYFVWIPRYKYKIFNEGNYVGFTAIENKTQTIEVIFENKNTNPSKGLTVGQYLTHPAFTSFDSNGMWVGKFESGYKDATTKEQAESNTKDSNKLEIKPNVYSWRGIQVSNAHLTSFNYQRDLDSHMMKNTEWGCIAFLTHSNYGQKETRINNNSDYITGYAAKEKENKSYESYTDYESTKLNENGLRTYMYNTSIGFLASTTGNISGIYDLSGGAWEWVMGVLKDKENKLMSGKNSLYHSGFNGKFGCPTCDSDLSGLTSLTTGINFPEAKYYDEYIYNDDSSYYKNRILGDATGEMGPFSYFEVSSNQRPISSWYVDESWFISNTFPWFIRGGSVTYGTSAGIFTFLGWDGNLNLHDSFRVVLIP